MGAPAHRTGDNALQWHEHLIAVAALLAMATFAACFARERLLADSGYFLVRIVDEEGFHVINHRWIMVLVQWLPVAGVGAGLPLASIMLLYSLGHVVNTALAHAWVALFLRDRNHTVVLLATQFVGLAHALFCPVFELYHAAVLLIALRATLQGEHIRTWPGAITACILFALVATSHFLGALVLFLMLALDRIWERRTLALGAALIFAALMAHRLSALSGYEERAFGTVLLRFNVDGVAWIFAPGRLWAHAVQAAWHYPDAILIGMFTVFQAWSRKAWWPFSLFISGHILLYTLISLYFPDGTHDRYRETLDYAHVLWVLAGATWVMQHDGRWRQLAWRIFPLLLALRLGWSIHVGQSFADRTGWMLSRITRAHELHIGRGLDTARMTIRPPGLNTAPLPAPSPCEYLLLSAMEGPGSTVVLVSMPAALAHDPDTAAIKLSLEQEGVMLPRRMDGRYFRMPGGKFTVMGQQAWKRHAPPRTAAVHGGKHRVRSCARTSHPPAHGSLTRQGGQRSHDHRSSHDRTARNAGCAPVDR